MLNKTHENLTICINEKISYNDTNINNKFAYLLSFSFVKNCDSTCNNQYNYEYIENKNECIINCENENMNVYNYNNYCYQKSLVFKDIKGRFFFNNSNNYFDVESCDKKCQQCTYESTVNNKCISCNNKYYSKSFIINNNSFVDCYPIEDYIINDTSLISSSFLQQTSSYIENMELNTIDSFINDDLITDDSTISNKNQISLLDLLINGGFNKNVILNFSEFININNDYSINLKGENEKEQFIKNELLNNSFELIVKILRENQKDIIIQEPDIFYQFTSSDNQKAYEYPKLSKILLEDCETKLRNHYKIPENESLLIYKIDKFIQGSLIPVVEYEIYNFKTKELLNLTYCNDTKINILYPTDIQINNLKLYNTSSEYYTDMCHSYTTEGGTDITLNDRKKEYINNNMSICEVNCDLNGYNKTSKKASCECQVKIKMPLISDIVINKDILYKKLVFSKYIVNLKIMKCYKALFTKKGLIKNSGSYIILSIILIIIINLILFLVKGYDILISQIKNYVSYKKKKETKNDNNNNNYKTKNNKKKKRKCSVNKMIIKNNIKMVNINFKNDNNNNPIKKGIKANKKYKLHLMKTNGIINDNNNDKINKKSSSQRKILINNRNILNNKKDQAKYNDYELNELNYNEAIKMDKRTFFQYYLSLLKLNQLLIFAFYTKNDNNSRIIKISIFFFSFALYYTINALFFDESAMHKIYVNQGNFIFIYQIPQIIYSSFISTIIMSIIRYFSLSQKEILQLKNEELIQSINKRVEETIKFLKIKFTLFFIIELLFLIFFWYYLSCFCAIYKNTQLFLTKDTLISFGFSLLYPIFICLLPGTFRILSLKDSKKNKNCLYKLSKVLQNI